MFLMDSGAATLNCVVAERNFMIHLTLWVSCNPGAPASFDFSEHMLFMISG